MPPLFIIVDMQVAVNTIKPFYFAMEMQEWFPLHCCQQRKYA